MSASELGGEDLRSARFLNTEKHPLWTFRSTGVRADGDGFAVNGELTINGATRSVPWRSR